MPIEQPPITIGELNNVPQPESAIRSPWAQAVSSRVVHRFPTLAAMIASNLPVQARAIVGSVEFLRVALTGTNNGFTRVTAYDEGIVGALATLNPPTTAQVSQITIPPDGGPRIVDVSCHVLITGPGYAAGLFTQLALRVVNTVPNTVIQQVTQDLLIGPNVTKDFFTTRLLAVAPANTACHAEVRCISIGPGAAPNVYNNPDTNRLYISCHPYA